MGEASRRAEESLTFQISGEADAGGGLRLRPREMVKIGQLVLAGGRWGDRQIVSKEWIEASTTRKIDATEGMSYGYLWWLGQTAVNGRPANWIGALGRGGPVYPHRPGA